LKATSIQSRFIASRQTFLATLVATFALASASSIGALVQVEFGAPTSYNVGNSPFSIVSADFDRDGRLDLATANHGTNSVSVLYGVGDGTLRGRTDYTVTKSPLDLAVGDFNKDTFTDLVVLGSAGGKTLFGNGSGGFTVTGLSNYLASHGITVADFDSDGRQDLATCNIDVAFGRGDGSFSLPTAYPGGVSDLAAGDLNGDGKPDLISASDSYSSVSVRLNNGAGSFGAQTSYGGGYDYHYSVALADFNGDGKLDVATANLYGASITVWLNVGNGSLRQATNCPVALNPLSVATGDFNRDDNADLVVRGSSSLQVLLGMGNGSFIPGTVVPVPTAGGALARSLAVGDFNRDGKPDIALTCYPNSVNVLLNQTLPVLEILLVSGHVQITWSAILGLDYTLETNTNLLSPSGWKPFPYPPVLIGDRGGVSDFVTDNKFYRLRR
jgi:hypothetical protein